MSAEDDTAFSSKQNLTRSFDFHHFALANYIFKPILQLEDSADFLLVYEGSHLCQSSRLVLNLTGKDPIGGERQQWTVKASHISVAFSPDYAFEGMGFDLQINVVEPGTTTDPFA